MPAPVSLASASPVYAGNGQLVAACLLGIAMVVVLITWAKVHPFLALIIGSATLGAVATMPASAILASFTKGFGDTTGSVGILIALGAMIGKLLEDSGGATRIVETIVGRVGPGRLPWAMALIAAIIGLPLFFEVGVVLLVPIVLLVARQTNLPVMKIGIPALAGLSVLHGLVPPHPGPLTAIALLKADLGLTLLYGLIVAIPTLVIAGPMLSVLITRMVPKLAPALDPAMAREREPASAGGSRGGSPGSSPTSGSSRPSRTSGGGAGPVGDDGVAVPGSVPTGRRKVSFVAALVSIVLPVALMLVDAITKLTVTDAEAPVRVVVDVIGTPAVALLLAVFVAFFAIGRGSGMSRQKISESLGRGLPGIATILLIVAAGGGFKQTLVDAGVGNVIKDWATGANISVLLLGWLVAVGIRLGTGSATVATITAAGIVGPLAATQTGSEVALLVLAIGCGSLFFSHVNDAGFWLVKEYFGLTVGETIKSWSLMETVISVVGFALVLVLNLVV
ncbi:MAG: GntP family permease [Actinomycetota bacterium]|nr:GntP family permease [Actinomycetota bacterium]